MEQFILNVAAMREAQRNYFRSRDQFNLAEAKRLEKVVDAELKKLVPQPEPQTKETNYPTLF